MDKSGGRLLLMAIVGWLLIEVGLTGRLGSLLASYIDPSALQDNQTSSGSAATGLINVAGLPTTGTLTPKQIGLYAINAGFGATSLQIAIAIALAESGGNIGATHRNSDGTTDYGVWQINSSHASYVPAQLLTPAYNASAAYNISGAGSNWNPWATYNSGAYLSQMAIAQQGAIDAAAANVGAG